MKESVGKIINVVVVVWILGVFLFVVGFGLCLRVGFTPVSIPLITIGFLLGSIFSPWCRHRLYPNMPPGN
jgi:hypothetical protein